MNKHLSIFIEVINYLLKKSLNVSLSQDQINNIYSLENFVDILHDKQIEFRYEKFDHSATPACEFVFSIKIPPNLALKREEPHESATAIKFMASPLCKRGFRGFSS